MQKYFIIIPIALIMFMLFNSCSDTNERRGRFSPEERTAQLIEELDLNAEQAEQIKQILTEQQEKFAEMREEFSGDRSEMMMAMRETREEYDDKIKEVLNDEQIEKYEEIQAERREQFRRRRERGQ